MEALRWRAVTPLGESPAKMNPIFYSIPTVGHMECNGTDEADIEEPAGPTPAYRIRH